MVFLSLHNKCEVRVESLTHSRLFLYTREQQSHTEAFTRYLEVERHSEQHTGSTADPEATEEEQPSPRGLHNEDLV